MNCSPIRSTKLRCSPLLLTLERSSSGQRIRTHQAVSRLRSSERKSDSVTTIQTMR
jgi:hypothetical protein